MSAGASSGAGVLPSAIVPGPSAVAACTTYPAWSVCRGPACVAGVCRGVTLPGDLACRGAACCKPGAGEGEPIAVASYLRRPPAPPGEAPFDDSPAINEALECAASRPHGAALVFAAGRYLLRTPLRPRSDDVTLAGPIGDVSGRAILVVDPCNPEQYPGAIQVSDRPIARLSIRGLRIELTDGPRIPPGDRRATSNSGVQLDRCTACTVEDVEVAYVGPDAPACKPYNLDGITFAMGSSGLVRRARVRGVPKVGIYLAGGAIATGPLRVEDSEVSECDGPLGATGISITASDVTVTGCFSHHNGLHPFPESPSPPERGNGLLIVAAPGPGRGPPVVPRHIAVVDSRFDDNAGHGVAIASTSGAARPEGIALTEVLARRNGENGVQIEAGGEVVLTRVEAAENGYHGIVVTAANAEHLLPTVRLGAVTMRDAIIHDNGTQPRFRADPLHPMVLPGIGLLGGAAVVIEGGRFFRSEGALGAQHIAVGIYPERDGRGPPVGGVRFVGPVARQGGALPPGAKVPFTTAGPRGLHAE